MDTPARQNDLTGYIRRQLWVVASMIVLVPVGFYSKYYRGPASEWVNASLGGTFYVIFWCLVVRFLWPKAAGSRIGIGVLAATCAIEFLQLWHPPLLEAMRSHFVGRTILGSTFDWSDFPYYFLGAVLGWLWLRKLPC